MSVTLNSPTGYINSLGEPVILTAKQQAVVEAMRHADEFGGRFSVEFVPAETIKEKKITPLPRELIDLTKQFYGIFHDEEPETDLVESLFSKY